jgi:uncharacterized HAD superfamily protein
MHIGYDIDGVLTKRDYTHISRFGVRGLIVFFQAYFPQIIRRWTLTQPLQDDIEIARTIASQHKISIITARPETFRKYTAQWLKNIARIEYDELHFVGLKNGFSQRKLTIAEDIGLDLFLDDTEDTVSLFQKEGIQAHLFQDWKSVQTYLDTL